MANPWHDRLQDRLKNAIAALIERIPAVHNILLHHYWARWHPISTAPYNRNLELRVIIEDEVTVLPFPCRHTNSGEWINSDIGAHIQVQPVEWRVWQRWRLLRRKPR